MNMRQTALLAATTLSGCTAAAPGQASFSEAYFASPVFQESPIGSWGGYTVDFSTGDVTGSGTAIATATASK
jgi:hypothetical protein